jgi:hypothetical protein
MSKTVFFDKEIKALTLALLRSHHRYKLNMQSRFLPQRKHTLSLHPFLAWVAEDKVEVEEEVGED